MNLYEQSKVIELLKQMRVAEITILMVSKYKILKTFWKALTYPYTENTYYMNAASVDLKCKQFCYKDHFN